MSYEEILLKIAAEYSSAVKALGGKSLARVATIVVNRGSFFDMIEKGGTCTLRSFEALIGFFQDPANWPEGTIPDTASASLSSIGKPPHIAEPIQASA